MTGQVLPRSEDLERAALGAVLADPALLAELEARLAPRDFYLRRHAAIYQACRDVAAGGAEPDLLTVTAHLERRGELAQVGGAAYLAALDSALIDTSRLPGYLDTLRDLSVRRQLVELGQRLTADASGDAPTADLLSQASRRLHALAVARSRRELRPAGEAVDEALQAAEAAAEAGADAGALRGLPTGLVDVDRHLHGLAAGHLVVVAGRPGMGKTALALTIAQHAALRLARPVAFFSLEMSRRELAWRMLCSEASVPFERLRRGHLSRAQWHRLLAAAQALDQAPLYLDDSPSPGPLEIAAKARRLQAQSGLGLVVVDYLQLLHADAGSRRRETRNLEIAAISRGFKALAKELDVPVLLLSQLSRGPEQRGADRRPQLADLRDSGAIEQDADVVAFVYREEVYRPEDESVRNLAELIIAKHRHGPTGTVELVYLGDVTTFRSLERQRGVDGGARG